MQKPENKSIRDFLNEQVSQDLQVPLEIVENVISWSFKEANRACEHNKEVEISGIGKLMISPGKLKKRIQSLERMDQSIQEEGRKKQEVQELLRILKTKLNGDQ